MINLLMSYKVFISIHYDFINDNINNFKRHYFIADLLYLYYKYSTIDIFDYDDTIHNIILEFIKLKNNDKNNYVKIKVNKKAIQRFKFLKELYIKIN
jgi:hypothetical protein